MKRKGAFLILAVFWAAAGLAHAEGGSQGQAGGPPQKTEQLSFPNTPAGRAAEAYFKAFAAGEGAMKAFFERFAAAASLEKMPVGARLERYRQMKGRLGRLEPVRIVASRPDFLSVAAKDKEGRRLRLDFELEAAEPFGLVGVRIEALGPPEEEGIAPDPKKDDAELLAAVRELAQKATDAGEFSGVILIARNGLPIFEEAYGLADRERGIPNTVATSFNIGSISKSFTALAVRMLAAERKLSFDDPIGKFLPDYPNRDAAARVTVRHLLDMTSGIGDFFGERFEAADKSRILSLPDYLPLFADKPLAFEPGRGSQYSNGGYIVLGLIIEKASGVDYYSFIAERVFRPAGMVRSGWPARDDQAPDRAVGYVREGSAWKPNRETLPGRGSSAGGGYSTARDLLRYVVALGKRAYGPAGDEVRGGLSIAGGAPGVNAVLEWMPDRRLVVVVMANMGPPAAGRMARQIVAWLPR